MTLPTPDAYNDAVQTPRLAFSDNELASGAVECNGFGIPKALGGGFAITYRLSARNGKSYAVRCFHKEVRNLQDRYLQIHSVLKANQSPLFVGFDYQQAGIKVKGVDYPIVKMEWATGITLGEYIEQNFQNRQAIEQLRSSFSRMDAELQQRGVAHGDLQNGNVLVFAQNALRLVDYDGMFVPGMSIGSGSELGHKHFQHPDRNAASFGPSIDRFAFLVIDLSFWAITLRPELYRRFSTGENILFSANDFADPASSHVFQELAGIADEAFQRALASFASVCKSPISSVPRLSDLLDGRNIPTAPISLPVARQSPQTYIGALPLVDASRFGEVCQHVGDKVELVGQILEVKVGSTRKGSPYVFINFGHWRDDCVRITIWSEGLKALGVTPDPSWHGQWVVVNGLVDPVYHGKNRYKTITYRSVGITLSDRSQLHKIGQDEALWRLGRGAKPGSPVLPNASPTPSRNEDILRNLQKRSKSTGASSWPTTSNPTQTHPTSQQQLATQPNMVKIRNEAILKGLSPSVSGHLNSSAGPRSSNQSTKPAVSESVGCFIALAIVIAVIVFIAFAGG